MNRSIPLDWFIKWFQVLSIMYEGQIHIFLIRTLWWKQRVMLLWMMFWQMWIFVTSQNTCSVCGLKTTTSKLCALINNFDPFMFQILYIYGISLMLHHYSLQNKDKGPVGTVKNINWNVDMLLNLPAFSILSTEKWNL